MITNTKCHPRLNVFYPLPILLYFRGKTRLDSLKGLQMAVRVYQDTIIKLLHTTKQLIEFPFRSNSTWLPHQEWRRKTAYSICDRVHLNLRKIEKDRKEMISVCAWSEVCSFHTADSVLLSINLQCASSKVDQLDHLLPSACLFHCVVTYLWILAQYAVC